MIRRVRPENFTLITAFETERLDWRSTGAATRPRGARDLVLARVEEGTRSCCNMMSDIRMKGFEGEGCFDQRRTHKHDVSGVRRP